MLGGNQARVDAASAITKFKAVRISTAARPDLAKQTSKVLKRIDVVADQHEASEDVAVKNVKAAADWDMPTDEQARIMAGAHVALWKRCAAGSGPLLIIEDGLVLPQRLPQIFAHLTACVERVVDEEDSTSPVILLLGAAVHPADYKEQWLPTDLQQQSNNEKVVLYGRARTQSRLDPLVECLMPNGLFVSHRTTGESAAPSTAASPTCCGRARRNGSSRRCPSRRASTPSSRAT